MWRRAKQRCDNDAAIDDLTTSWAVGAATGGLARRRFKQAGYVRSFAIDRPGATVDRPASSRSARRPFVREIATGQARMSCIVLVHDANHMELASSTSSATSSAV